MRRLLCVCVLSAPALLMTGCEGEGPRIGGVNPLAGLPGEYITITGEGFGKNRDESFVSVAGTRPTASSYRQWSDTQIVFKLPEFGDAGLVYVYKDNQKSNPAIFLSSATIPRAVRQSRLARPVIDSGQEGISGFVGRTITLRGTGFGETRESRTEGAPSAARFSSLYTPEGEEYSGASFALPDAGRGGYQSWKEREIVARIPDGAGNGVVDVMTEQGESNKIPFSARYRGGTKTLRDKRVYALSYSVDITVVEAGTGAALSIWFPTPPETAAQKNERLLSRSPQPFLERYRDADLYRFTGLKAGFRETISVERLVQTAVLETRVDAALINTAVPAGFEKIYLKESPLVPSLNAEVQKAAAEITGSEQNPYRKARLIYNALVSSFQFEAESSVKGAPEALRTRRADAAGASLLFCALARAGGVAAAPLAGVYVDRGGVAYPHCWAQFWIEDFGWVPLDVYMGSGALPAPDAARADARDYYFGNVDNRRIAFSEGEPELPPLEPQGRISTPPGRYSLQTIHEEASAGLKAYSARWSGVTINAIY